MNANTMTLSECRDWLAREDGWKLEAYGTGHIWYPKGYPDCRTAIRGAEDHPYPPTLDGAAGALPADLRVVISRDKLSWGCQAWGRWVSVMVTGAPDEITARYRLAVSCRLASKEAI
jgi:hypothetical protein